MTTAYPQTKNALAGVTFFGTPHTDTDSEALLQAVRGTVEAFGSEDGARGEDIREYVSVASRINATFVSCKPSYLRTLSFWEKLPSKSIGPSSNMHGRPVCSFISVKKRIITDTLVDRLLTVSEREIARQHRSHNRMQPRGIATVFKCIQRQVHTIYGDIFSILSGNSLRTHRDNDSDAFPASPIRYSGKPTPNCRNSWYQETWSYS